MKKPTEKPLQDCATSVSMSREEKRKYTFYNRDTNGKFLDFLIEKEKTEPPEPRIVLNSILRFPYDRRKDLAGLLERLLKKNISFSALYKKHFWEFYELQNKKHEPKLR